MAMLDDALEGNVAMLAAAGAATLVLPVILPVLAPPLRSALKSGLTLFLESEAEVEGGVMGALAEGAVKAVLDTVAGTGPREHRQVAAQEAVQRFEATARARSKRYAWNENDAALRYRRHVAHFHRALARAQEGGSARRRQMLVHAAQVLADDW